MSNVNTLEKLTERINNCSILITYRPLADEEDPDSLPLFSPDSPTKRLFVSSSRSTPPENYAQKFVRACRGKKVCLLIPGKKFDYAGARIGRGGGWYDRFLATVPADWLRIGVAKKQSLSRRPLKKRNWDESVDWLIWQENKLWRVRQTKARQPQKSSSAGQF